MDPVVTPRAAPRVGAIEPVDPREVLDEYRLLHQRYHGIGTEPSYCGTCLRIGEALTTLDIAALPAPQDPEPVTAALREALLGVATLWDGWGSSGLPCWCRVAPLIGTPHSTACIAARAALAASPTPGVPLDVERLREWISNEAVAECFGAGKPIVYVDALLARLAAPSQEPDFPDQDPLA